MNRRIHRLPTARRDLVEIFQHLIQHAGLATARRFRAEAEATFGRLVRMPGIGASYDPDDPSFQGLRVFPVSRHRKYLVFYQPVDDGINVLRILHGARDIAGILEEDLGLVEPDDRVDG